MQLSAPLMMLGLALWLLAIGVFVALPFLAVRSLRSGTPGQYERWFTLVRIVLGVIMVFYALIKPYVQLRARAAPHVLVGDVSDFELFWYFFSLKRLYVWFTCGSELLAGALILWKRTHRFGLLMMCAVMANVVALDFAFLHDQPVRFWALALLIAAGSCVVRELPLYLGVAKQLLHLSPAADAQASVAVER
jgi:hypothetical protein